MEAVSVSNSYFGKSDWDEKRPHLELRIKRAVKMETMRMLAIGAAAIALEFSIHAAVIACMHGNALF